MDEERLFKSLGKIEEMCDEGKTQRSDIFKLLEKYNDQGTSFSRNVSSKLNEHIDTPHFTSTVTNNSNPVPFKYRSRKEKVHAVAPLVGGGMGAMSLLGLMGYIILELVKKL